VPTCSRFRPYDVGVDPLADAIDRILAAGRRLGARGLISAGEGNLSVRLDADRLLTTPTGLRKDELTPDDLVIVWIDHPEREAVSRSGHRPSSDLAIHLAVHQARRDIGAVAHAHLPASMGLTLAGEVPDPAALPETALLLPRLPFVPLGVPGSEELAGRIAAALSEPPEPPASAVLLERHGAVAVGRDPGHAVDRLELVEVLCRTWRDALLTRAARAAMGIVDERTRASETEGP
jgi:L-fuculose-phosphate aldolase